MKFLELNESEEEKLVKKGKTIFKALKTGTIGSIKNPKEPRFSYKLWGDVEITVNNVGILAVVDRLTIKELNDECKQYDKGFLKDKVRTRFGRFGVWLQNIYTEIEPYSKEHNINEEDDHREITEKEEKKARLVYSLHKTGKFKSPSDDRSGLVYKYVLPDEYQLTKNDDVVTIVIANYEEHPLKVYAIFEENRTVLVDENDHKYIYGWIKDKIKTKFQTFNLDILF